MYDTILVPTDGSEHANRAAAHGRTLAAAFDATVHVLNVVDIQTAAGPFSAGGVDQSFVDRLEQAGQNTVETTTATFTEEGIDAVQTAVVRGRPAAAIREYAADHDVDLLAMGTHGRTGVKRYVAGSVTERVVRTADRPVLTAHATERSRVTGGYDDILVPTDGSEFAAMAVEHAIAIAAQFDSRVHAINVVDRGELPRNPSTDLVERHEADGQAATEEIAADARDAGLDAVTEVRDGFAGEELLAYAAEHDVDLIAMATAGRTGLSQFLLGSTTERVIRHAEAPVLAVNVREQA